jgi:hypothetical protein
MMMPEDPDELVLKGLIIMLIGLCAAALVAVALANMLS